MITKLLVDLRLKLYWLLVWLHPLVVAGAPGAAGAGLHPRPPQPLHHELPLLAVQLQPAAAAASQARPVLAWTVRYYMDILTFQS